MGLRPASNLLKYLNAQPHSTATQFIKKASSLMGAAAKDEILELQYKVGEPAVQFI